MNKKEYERIEKAAPDVALDTQLPDEVIESIKEEADTYAGTQVWINKNSSPEHLFHEFISATSFERGYTECALKLHQAQQEIESLANQLKDYSGVADENMKLLRLEHEKVIGYLQKTMNIISWQELPDSSCAEILNEIKQYLDGSK